MSDIANRVKAILEKKGLTNYQLSQKTGISEATLSRLVKGVNKPNASTLKALANFFKVDEEWLLTGSSSSNNYEEHGIPYYDLDITAGDIPVFLDQSQVQPEHHINIFGFSDCTHAFPVYGHSMHPVICNGDVGLFRYIQDKSIILWGSIYLVITRDYRTIKFVRKGQSDEFVILRSHSQNHDDIDIRRDEILELFLYKGKIERTQM